MTAPGPLDPGLMPRRPRWRWMVSLRGLMVVVLVIGGLLGWLVRVEATRRQALAMIAAAGGQVIFRDSDPKQTGGWLWLYRRTGLERFREPWYMALDSKRPPATEIVAWETRVTPAGAAAFKALRPGTSLAFGPEPADD